MIINCNKEGEKLSVLIEGRLDTTTAPEFEGSIAENLNGISELVLDMTKLEYVSSAGLRVILKLQKTMSKDGKMTLTGVNESVMEVFEITGFYDILNIE